MEPQIRYLRTADGVTIAYHEMGEGVPLVDMNMPYSHLQVEWRVNGELFAAIAREARLVRYDHRGFGLSERDVELSLDGFVLDLEAVVDRLELPPFVLMAARGPTTPIAVAYAVRHPERVASLVLYNASARAPDALRNQLTRLLEMSEDDWYFGSEGIARLVAGWDDDQGSHDLADLLRASTDLNGFRRWLDTYLTWDVTELLPLVRARTLLTNQLGHPWFAAEYGRAMATVMPDARCAVVDAPTGEEREAQTIAAVREFLDAPAPEENAPAAGATGNGSGTAVILFADIVDSTAMTEKLGDAAFRERARQLDERMRTAIRAASGVPVEGKLLGDGVLAVFSSARQAIDAALRCAAAGGEFGLRLHLGIHAGDVIREGDNVFGGAVNIASRISGLSAPDQVLVSATVRDLARTSAGVTFENRGEHELKGVSDSVRVFAVSTKADG